MSLKRNLSPASETFSAYLIRKGLLSPEQLEIVHEEQRSYQFPLLQEEKTPYSKNNDYSLTSLRSFEKILLSLGFFQEDQLIQHLSFYSGYPIIDIQEYVLSFDLLEESFLPVLKKYKILPLQKHTQKNEFSSSFFSLEVAVVDAYDIKALDHIRFLYQVDHLVIKLCTEKSLVKFFDGLLIKQNTFHSFLKKIPLDLSLAKMTLANPVEEFLDFMVTHALSQQATDIHFQPHPQWVQLDYRIKGLLQPLTVFHKKYWGFISTRLKLMASLDIANNRLPQSGQFIIFKGHQEIACRLSTHPLMTVTGIQEEAIVLRFLNTGGEFFSLEKLGFSEKIRKKLQKLIEKSQGLTIITGPTGSGKTTTVYSLLRLLKEQALKMMTLEDPIEFFFPFLYQTELRKQEDFTFEEALKSILRQDPDMLFIGEIRDKKAAQLAIQTTMIGHPVFTTLHAGDALSAIPRLINLGIDPHLLIGRIDRIIAQRLVRQLCSSCKRPISNKTVDSQYQKFVPFLQEAQGCQYCNFTGYQGRLPLIEILETNEAFHQLILSPDYGIQCKKWAESIDFIPLAMNAFQLLLQGEISLEEALSQTALDQWLQDYPPLVHTILNTYIKNK